MAYLVLSLSWPVKHWHCPQGAREEPGNEVRGKGWKVWKQTGACAISSLWESEGYDCRWCLFFRDMLMMHFSKELQQGLRFVWRWFSCVFCQPWEKIFTSESGEHWIPFISIPRYTRLLCMRHGSILLVIPGEISSNPEKKIKSKKYVYTQLQDVLCLYFRVNKLERNMSLT